MIYMGLDDFDEAIDEWHEGAGAGTTLHNYLGLTWGQYTVLVAGGQVLPCPSPYTPVIVKVAGEEEPPKERYEFAYYVDATEEWVPLRFGPTDVQGGIVLSWVYVEEHLEEIAL